MRRDRLSRRQRSQLMAKIRAKDTGPERAVRKALRRLGYAYRSYRSDLPGTPDVVISKLRIAIFVHGCFWHGHKCVSGRNIPATNRRYWLPKLASNKQRDAENISQLRKLGWKTVVIWECEARNPQKIENILNRFFAGLESRGKGKSLPRG